MRNRVLCAVGACLLLTGCLEEGPKGDKGDQGPKGNKGDPGESPVVVLTGSRAPNTPTNKRFQLAEFKIDPSVRFYTLVATGYCRTGISNEVTGPTDNVRFQVDTQSPNAGIGDQATGAGSIVYLLSAERDLVRIRSAQTNCYWVIQKPLPVK